MRRSPVSSAMLPTGERQWRTAMKWITREHPRVDRVACPWLIERFVDKQAEFLYVRSDQVAAEAQKRGATPYDIKDVELGHHGVECSFDAFVHKYALAKDPAMAGVASTSRTPVPIASTCSTAKAADTCEPSPTFPAWRACSSTAGRICSSRRIARRRA